MSSHTLISVGGNARHILERAIRQAWQTALPLLLLVNPAGQFSITNTTLAILGAVAVTGIKSVLSDLAGWQGTDIVSRSIAAFAGVFAGAGVTDLAGWVHLDWAHTSYGALVATVISAGAYYLTPPAVSADGPSVVVNSVESGGE